MTGRNPLIAALDLDDPKAALAMAHTLAPHVGLVKVGSVGYAAGGPELVRQAVDIAPVFLDLKLHDIPNTVAAAVAALNRHGVKMLTIHASGGAEMVEAAVAHAGDVRILAVTVLTHLDATGLAQIGFPLPPEDEVARLAHLAHDAGAHGIVCSPQEVRRLRRELGPDVLLVIPGIRPAWSATDEQRRAATPRSAIDAGADYLVIGRPILRAPDPGAAARRILDEIAGADS